MVFESTSSKLALVELVVYIILLFPCIWILWKLEFPLSLNWILIISLSLLHIVGSSYQITNQHAEVESAKVNEVLDTVGLVPLLLVSVGLLQRL